MARDEYPVDVGWQTSFPSIIPSRPDNFFAFDACKLHVSVASHSLAQLSTRFLPSTAAGEHLRWCTRLTASEGGRFLFVT
jgi:hypothetical protein